ncbi:MAG: helix-turn-helix domain-containing protein [Bifidobacterium longum]
MTAGTLEKVYTLHDPRINGAAGAVLSYYAYRAYYADGRCAWPATETIAASCFLDKRTVIRARALLIELGYMRVSPDQTWNARDPETGEWKRKNNRTTVYDVLTENFHPDGDAHAAAEEERAMEREEAREGTCTGRMRGTSRSGKQGCQNVTPRKPLESGRSTGVSECHPSQTRPSAAPANGDILTGLGCQNVTQLTNNQPITPLPPTEASPRDGESRDGEGQPDTIIDASDGTGATDATTGDGDEHWQDATDGAAAGIDARGRAERLVERLQGRRAAMGLTPRPAGPRDLDAVTRLVERLDAAGEPDTSGLMERVLDHALDNGFQAKRVDTGRRFARLFDELRDDLTCDQRTLERRRREHADTGQTAGSDTGESRPAEPESYETRARRMLADRIGDDADAPTAIRALADRLRLDPDPDPGQAARYAELALRAGRKTRAEQARRESERSRELHDYRASHGGSCFAGNWQREQAE